VNEGYDDETGFFMASAQPTETIEVGEAVDLLSGLLNDFDFVTSGDRSRATGKRVVCLACMVDSWHTGVWGRGWIRGGSEEWEPDIETKKLASTEYYSAYTSSPVPRFEGTLALAPTGTHWGAMR